MERILCAAIWYKDQPTPLHNVKNIDKGVVLCGHRHAYIVGQFKSLTGKRSVLPECGEYEQGFLTDHNNFIDRKEAMRLAKLSGQVPTNQSFEELYSEDLY